MEPFGVVEMFYMMIVLGVTQVHTLSKFIELYTVHSGTFYCI